MRNFIIHVVHWLSYGAISLSLKTSLAHTHFRCQITLIPYHSHSPTRPYFYSCFFSHPQPFFFSLTSHSKFSTPFSLPCVPHIDPPPYPVLYRRLGHLTQYAKRNAKWFSFCGKQSQHILDSRHEFPLPCFCSGTWDCVWRVFECSNFSSSLSVCNYIKWYFSDKFIKKSKVWWERCHY